MLRGSHVVGRRLKDDPGPLGRLALAWWAGSMVTFFQVLSFDVYDPVLPWLTFAGVAGALWWLMTLGARRRAR